MLATIALISACSVPVEEEQNHPLLRGRKRTPFWWKDAAEQDIPLRLTPKFNPEMQRAGTSLPVDVAPAPVPRPAKPAEPAGRAVLLAQTTDDLYDERERVRAHLDQFGVKVVPENDLPQGGATTSACRSWRIRSSDCWRTFLFAVLLAFVLLIPSYV